MSTDAAKTTTTRPSAVRSPPRSSHIPASAEQAPRAFPIFRHRRARLGMRSSSGTAAFRRACGTSSAPPDDEGGGEPNG